MPITPDEFARANEFDAAFAAAQRGHEDVPAYDAEHLSLDDIATSRDLRLPLSHWVWEEPQVPGKSYRQQAIVTMFHKAILEKNSELVLAMVRRGVVSPDVPDITKQTPLGTAIGQGNLHMVKLLLDLGAAVNAPSRKRDARIPRWQKKKYGNNPPDIERTPLMLAAADGRLAIVKLLLDSGADDGIIAPDGQLALRLASDGGHRDIVDYLPARRGGALRRWMVHNGQALDRLQRAGEALYHFIKVFVWDIPKYFLFDFPRAIVKGMTGLAKWVWKKLRTYGSRFRRVIADLPNHLRAAAQGLWHGLRRLPRVLKNGVDAAHRVLKVYAQHIWVTAQELPTMMAEIARKAGKATRQAARWFGQQVIAIPSHVVAAVHWTRDAALTVGRWTRDAAVTGAYWTGRAAKATAWFAGRGALAISTWLWRAICAVPAALVIVWKWLKTSTTAIGRALFALLAKPIALLHTAALAVISLIRRARTVTLADVWAGLTAVANAIIDLHRQVWRALEALLEAGFNVAAKVFGTLGVIVYVVVYGIGWAVVSLALFIPRQVFTMLKATGSSLRKGGHEVAVWINPKW